MEAKSKRLPVVGRVRSQLGSVAPLVDPYRAIRRTIRHQRVLRRPSVRTPYGFVLAGTGRKSWTGSEKTETALVSQLLTSAELFVDIGANIGFYTCLARAAGVPAIAVEPMPGNLQFLFRNLESNGYRDVMVLPVALFARAGFTRMFGERTGASVIEGWAGATSRRSVQVPLLRADDILPGLVSGRRTVVKVDVEGAEADLLAGAQQLLRCQPAPVWLIEVALHEHHPTGRHPRFREVFQAFWEAEYMVNSLPELRPVTPEDVDRWLDSGKRDFGSYNYFVVPTKNSGFPLAGRLAQAATAAR